MSLYIESSGFLTSIQDGGRYGYQEIGVSPAGPMDSRAFKIANLLVGNDMNASALEMTYTGPTVRFQCDSVIALTGADMSASLDNEPVARYRAVVVHSGQTLKFGKLQSGLRGYLAFSSGLDIPLVMGSQATLLRNKIGGFNGRALRNGDTIRLKKEGALLQKMGERRFKCKDTYDDSITIRVILGPQCDAFTAEGIATFFQDHYEVTNELDRMGCRLTGAPIEHAGSGNIISDGIAAGSIQVPGHGLPIIMLAERQTTGGYPKIATVISCDLPKLAQVKPGVKIKFTEIGIKKAQKLYLKEVRAMKRLQTKWRDDVGGGV